jgi:hypothetical protein
MPSDILRLLNSAVLRVVWCPRLAAQLSADDRLQQLFFRMELWLRGFGCRR